MNRGFVNIKVDREQRPDIDEIYMTACQVFTQMTTGRASGAGRCSAFYSVTLKPFFVDTFPALSIRRQAQLHQVLEGMASAWRRSPRSNSSRNVSLGTSWMHWRRANPNGGSGWRKFRGPGSPDVHSRPHRWGSVPLRSFRSRSSSSCSSRQDGIVNRFGAFRLTLIEWPPRALRSDRRGFHRYSTDGEWLVPHFEKMLYDNAQLASVYAESHARTGDRYHARIASETVDYVLREMTDRETGAFYSAQDAEVNGHEGENYLWTPAELIAALEGAGLEGDVPLALSFLGLDRGTNFQDPHHRELPPTNVLHLIARPDAFAASRGVSCDEIEAFLDRVRPALLAARNRRDQPGLDDKIITAWNGLGQEWRMRDASGEVRLRLRRFRAARHILHSMRDETDGLMRTARDGVVTVPGFLEDYAFKPTACWRCMRRRGGWMAGRGWRTPRREKLLGRGWLAHTRAEQRISFVHATPPMVRCRAPWDDAPGHALHG